MSYELISPDDIYPEEIDALLVLGRGIEADGTLSDTGIERAEEAVLRARKLDPDVVVFSGGRSWVQVIEGIEPPSEGGAMLAHAMAFSEGHIPACTKFLAEETSDSTVANMVNSKPLLNLKENALLGILSDERHFSRGRVQFLGGLVFPDVSIVPYKIADAHEPTPEEIAEERLTNMMTRLFMTGVTPGNDRAIMHRQRMLEKGNAAFRRLTTLRAIRNIGSTAASVPSTK